jgi:uncharacterized protein
MLNSIAKIFFFAYLLLTLNQALAEHVESLYDVEVLVADETADARSGALKSGLDEVFIRISGDSIIMDKLERPAASRYIQQYSYDPVKNPVTNKDGELLNYRLKIQYNGSAMANYLRKNGFPVWGEHRPELVIWLAIRDGRNEYVLKDGDKSLLKASADEALHRRGIPERWPLYDSKDRKILKVADIRGGFKDPVAKASKRYGRGPALTGSLIWNGNKWQSSWSLLMESSNRHWSIEDADYNQLINKAVDQAADAMGIVFAIHGIGKDQDLVSIQLHVQSVNSISKYRKLENYLRDLSAVTSVVPLIVDGQSATFELSLRSNEADFLNLVKNDAELLEVKAIKPQPGPPAETQSNAAVAEKTADTQGNAAEANVAERLQNTAQTSTPAIQKPKMPVYYYKLIK